MSTIVLENGRLTYSREQTFGGKQLLNDLQRNLGLSLRDSREFLRGNKKIGIEHQQIIENFMGSAAQEIERALQLFYSSENAIRLDNIILAGGFASMDGMVQKITAGSETETFVIKPFSGMNIGERVEKSELENDQPALLTALGLAIRGFGQ